MLHTLMVPDTLICERSFASTILADSDDPLAELHVPRVTMPLSIRASFSNMDQHVSDSPFSLDFNRITQVRALLE